MATNDLITRLILQTKEFDGNLQRSAKEMRNFEKEISGKVGKGIKQFDVGLKGLGVSLGSLGWGAAIAGGVAFAKMGIDATQASDKFNNIMNASKQTLESFAGALITADMSTFSDGLLTAWQRAQDLSAALDTLADTLLAKRIFDARTSYEFNESLNKVKNTSLSLEERQKALNDAREQNTKLGEKNLKVQNQIKDVVEKMWLTETGQNITNEQIRNLAEVGDEYDDIYAKQQALNKAASKVMVDPKTQIGYGAKKDVEAYNDARKALSGYSKEQITLAKNWQKFNDEQRKNLADNLIQESQLHQQRIGQDRQLLEGERSLETQRKAGAGSKKNTQKDEVKTLQDQVKLVNELYNKWQNATDPLIAYNAHLEWQKENQLLETVTGKNAKLKAPSTPVIIDVPAIIDPSSITIDQEKLRKFQQLHITALQIERQDQFNDSLKKTQSTLREYTIGLDGIANGLSILSSEGQKSAADYINSISSILTGLSELFAAYVATGTAGAAAAQSAGGVIGVVAGVAGALAAFASITSSITKPKFAGGGIVGDQNLVRINSGEMILNHAQQTRLFNAINSGRTETQSASPVEFVIRGQDLIGVQKNYNSKFGKK